MRVALITLGCRVNQAESASIEGTLKEHGAEIVGLDENPDYCIVNTCTVTAKSDYNSRQVIRRAARAGAKVIVTGCYSQLSAEAVRNLPGVVRIVDNTDKEVIPSLLEPRARKLFFRWNTRSRPHLKVQDGCNNRCSYCTVPLARGRSRSTGPAEVLERVSDIASQGYKEVVLTGIHLGTYGTDLGKGISLTTLVRDLLNKTGIHRIRLSSLEISEVDDELLYLFQSGRLCRHLHLPLQSGSDEVLSRMKRTYSSQEYALKIERIVSGIDNVSLGTDVIVGFPGEDDRHFQETVSLVSDLPFSYLHIFPYSRRPGTEAYSMKESPVNVKERTATLKVLNREKKKAYMTRQIGENLEVVLEELLLPGVMAGTSSNYLKIAATACSHPAGTLVTVRPVRIVNEQLHGNIVS